ncbi:MAG: hypothetical protein WD046_13860 [Paracoccaceae bacterium]
MAALIKGRNTPERSGDIRNFGLAASTMIYAGSLVALNAAGALVPASTATTLTIVGRAEADVDNTDGSAGDLACDVRTGIFRYANSADADEITAAEIGDACYAVDDQTVAKTDGTSTRSVAGTIFHVDDLGVWVKIA